MDSQKTEIAERLKQANNVLVTVSKDPTVDQLSAAIGLTVLLNHMGKHATAVFSGQVPSTMEFLEPEMTLEKTTDSLRDFIIALDKNKADKLRYKVQDDMVKIFITPYRTSISDKDLEFSQGDFNVDVVIALGVNDQADLDQAITSHGRILHDATVVTVGVVGGSLGSINWNDPNASSLCELIVSLCIDLKDDAIDEQIATALLTGIVAETERFSNEKTSSETMQLSARLMAAGANQQLVASQLQKPESEQPTVQKMETSGELTELPELDGEGEAPAPKPADDGSLHIEHNPDEVPAEPAREPSPEEQIAAEAERLRAQEHAETPESPELRKKVVQPIDDTETEEPKTSSRLIMDPPSLGGSLTANTQPEGMDPPMDMLGVQPPSGPMLNHEETAKQAATGTLADLEKTLQSPHIGQATDTGSAPAPEPLVPAPTSQPVADAVPLPEPPLPAPAPTPPPDNTVAADLDAARDAVVNAVTSSPSPILEPVQALNAQPVDLTPPAPIQEPSTTDEPATESEQSSDDSESVPSINISEDGDYNPGAPPQIINPTVTSDPTVDSAIAPPPVPPPMVPPLMPISEPPKPGDNAL